MQITFNVPPALQRDLEWLAEKQGANVDALTYITAFLGFVKDLERKVIEEQQREEADKPHPSQPVPIDWSTTQPPAPIRWPKYGKAVQR